MVVFFAGAGAVLARAALWFVAFLDVDFFSIVPPANTGSPDRGPTHPTELAPLTTATATPTAAGTILAIDLGRYKRVACAYDRAATAARYHTLDSTRAAVERLLTRYPGAVVVVEACANAGSVHDLALEHGLAVRWRLPWNRMNRRAQSA
jgi:hypothetical protein